ncbi:MAG: hypothetical protein J0I30_04420, partial [Burkholderiales bacterium]|nr:hypothetical protein [Burkholderiales bacterium]
MTVLALSSDMQGLNRALSDITAELSRMSIVPVRESLNTELSFWAQLPLNFIYIARRPLISSM